MPRANKPSGETTAMNLLSISRRSILVVPFVPAIDVDLVSFPSGMQADISVDRSKYSSSLFIGDNTRVTRRLLARRSRPAGYLSIALEIQFKTRTSTTAIGWNIKIAIGAVDAPGSLREAALATS